MDKSIAHSQSGLPNFLEDASFGLDDVVQDNWLDDLLTETKAKNAKSKKSKNLPTPLVPAPVPPTCQWDPRLVLDLAIAVDDLSVILARYDLSEAEFNLLSDTPVFRRELALAMRDARENGVGFQVKAKIQAESYLSVLDSLVYDSNTPASVRLECIRSAVQWGALLPKEAKADSTQNATQINVNISF